MTKFDFHRRAAADRQRRQGSDRINDFDVPVGFRSPPRKRQSKAEARAEIERLLAEHAAKEKAQCFGGSIRPEPSTSKNERFKS